MISDNNNADELVNGFKKIGLADVFNKMDSSNSFHFISDGSWCTHDFFIGALDKFKNSVDVYIMTYSMTEFSARVLAGFVANGKIKNLNIIMDTKSFVRYPNVHQLVNNISKLVLTPLHAKVLIICNNDKACVMIGSSNWTKNPKIEVGAVSSSKSLANDYVNWMTTKMKLIENEK